MKNHIQSTEIPDVGTRLTLTGKAENISAQADIRWHNTPIYQDHPIGTIGAFQATDAASTRELLAAACHLLKSKGSKIAVGPMDGNTWAKHRFVTESDGRPPFLMEPENPAEYPQWWLDAGFEVLSTYCSSEVLLNGTTLVSPGLKKRILASGVSISDLDPTRFEEELRAIHTVSLRSFANNFLYTPLPQEHFLAAYTAIQQQVDPALVKLARKDGELIGFIFGIPDLSALQRQEKPALIAKTLAVDPSARAAGLGSLLVDELHHTGEEKGYQTAIHALQYESNSVRKITDRSAGKTFRRYTLFSKLL